MRISASKLRDKTFEILDECVKTGKAVEVVRKGKVVRLVPEGVSKFANPKKRNALVGNIEDIIHIDWLAEWSKENSK